MSLFLEKVVKWAANVGRVMFYKSQNHYMYLSKSSESSPIESGNCVSSPASSLMARCRSSHWSVVMKSSSWISSRLKRSDSQVDSSVVFHNFCKMLLLIFAMIRLYQRYVAWYNSMIENEKNCNYHRWYGRFG